MFSAAHGAVPSLATAVRPAEPEEIRGRGNWRTGRPEGRGGMTRARQDEEPSERHDNPGRGEQDGTRSDDGTFLPVHAVELLS